MILKEILSKAGIEGELPFLEKDFIYLLLEREEGRERNINVWLPLMRPLLGT